MSQKKTIFFLIFCHCLAGAANIYFAQSLSQSLSLVLISIPPFLRLIMVWILRNDFWVSARILALTVVLKGVSDFLVVLYPDQFTFNWFLIPDFLLLFTVFFLLKPLVGHIAIKDRYSAWVVFPPIILSFIILTVFILPNTSDLDLLVLPVPAFLGPIIFSLVFLLKVEEMDLRVLKMSIVLCGLMCWSGGIYVYYLHDLNILKLSGFFNYTGSLLFFLGFLSLWKKEKVLDFGIKM